MLRLYDSLSREKRHFAPLDPAHIRVYACGPTVYSFAHIGNARMAVVFDVLVRVLRAHYPRVTYVSNITDIDDKIMDAARASATDIPSLTNRFTRIYNDNMTALNVVMPDIQPRATETIPEMVALIEQLITRGHAYEAQGHVLFHVPSFPAYGGLSGRSRDEQIAGARVDVAPYKKDPADFVLWKPSTDTQPGWDSPWGRGRPGWHIECSAMAAAHLGMPFDIHGGGADLKFPHHENEIAQSCCAAGITDDLSAFAKIWVHNGFVTVNGEKMSKSLGNVMLVDDLLKDWSGEVLRLTLISAHYRQPLDLSYEKIAENARLLEKFHRRLAACEGENLASYPAPSTVMTALCDDLNTPQALAALNALLNEKDSPALKSNLLAAGNMLGLFQNANDWAQKPDEIPSEIIDLLQERSAAKSSRDFKRADDIRDLIAAKGYKIEDTPDGPVARLM